YTLSFLWLLSFSSATHDIAADGFYMLATTEKEQAFFVGIRSTFYRLSMISGQGLLVILAGIIQSHTGLPKVILEVNARMGTALVQRADVESFSALTPNEEGLRVIIQPINLQISPEPRPKLEVESLLASVRDWNTT